MNNRIEELEKENAKLKSALEKCLDILKNEVKECDVGLKQLNEDTAKNYPNMNGMFDENFSLSYMLEVGRHAWAFRARKMASYSVMPIINDVLKK